MLNHLRWLALGFGVLFGFTVLIEYTWPIIVFGGLGGYLFEPIAERRKDS